MRHIFLFAWFPHLLIACDFVTSSSSILTYYIVIKDRSKASFTKDWHNFLNDLNLELPTMFQGFVKKKCLQKWATKWNSRQRRYLGCCCAKKSDAEHYGEITWGLPSKNNFSYLIINFRNSWTVWIPKNVLRAVLVLKTLKVFFKASCHSVEPLKKEQKQGWLVFVPLICQSLAQKWKLFWWSVTH